MWHHVAVKAHTLATGSPSLSCYLQDPELLPLSVVGLSQPTACSLACSSTGVLAYPAGTCVVLCKAGTERRFLRARGSSKPLACVAFSAAGQHIAAGGDGDQVEFAVISPLMSLGLLEADMNSSQLDASPRCCEGKKITRSNHGLLIMSKLSSYKRLLALPRQ